MEFDFTVYAKRDIPYIDKHSRRGQRAYSIINEPTSLVVSEAVRRRLTAIPDVRWLNIYECLATCGRVKVEPQPPPCAGRR